MTDPIEPVPVWKRGLAATLDVFTAFFLFGWLKLDGGPAVVMFVLIVSYFLVGRRYAGGTLWDRVLRIGRPQPK